MKIQLASDLHVEFHDDYGKSIGEDLTANGGADILVLAGDISNATGVNMYRPLLDELTPHYKYIVMTLGNHDYYGTDPKSAHIIMNELEELYPNLHILINDYVVLDDQRFIGGTGWFPEPAPHEVPYKKYMNDFRLIKDLEPFCYNSNGTLTRLLAKEITENDILVTHHIPQKSIHPMYANNALNCFFTHGLDGAYGIPKLAFHGHTHKAVDYQIEGTRVIANPRGYPGEGSGFNNNLIITV